MPTISHGNTYLLNRPLQVVYGNQFRVETVCFLHVKATRDAQDRFLRKAYFVLRLCRGYYAYDLFEKNQI